MPMRVRWITGSVSTNPLVLLMRVSVDPSLAMSFQLKAPEWWTAAEVQEAQEAQELFSSGGFPGESGPAPTLLPVLLSVAVSATGNTTHPPLFCFPTQKVPGPLCPRWPKWMRRSGKWDWMDEGRHFLRMQDPHPIRMSSSCWTIIPHI